MGEFHSSQKIGEIVTKFPKSADILKEYRIDFCCGGDRPLITAIKEQGLNEAEILDRINNLYEEVKSVKTEDIDWEKESMSKLIDHVVNTHHAYLGVELPIISELTTKILRVHGEGHPELSKVHKLFHSLKMELEQHLIKEEEIEFPLIKKYEENPSKEALEKILKVEKELEEEHVGAGDILKELRKITKDYAVPEDGCNSYRLTYKKLEELEADTFQHIHLENNILFPRLENENK
ncbi:iron-sulfur cluster repair di-iron protein [Clostridium omnivorum]|uniref:Iron-sulfur cluster repair di-iron protein n=1 Tax=Clostridium omnivorum TaxID=1604902 RepID=A0ABQ5N607_9CLOT|nr:iron-sulfur cluster repair di-iron protein [Clostridium sp. E14]GLC30647.1 iron-sulfur cluster repair di-iron protein [Clostridium sp. E14]